MNIDEILKDIPDKFKHRTTTSHKFKKDVFEFFNKDEFKNKICIEWGSNLGYSTKVLSYLFKEVVGFNKDRAVEAIEFNSKRTNVKYFTQDIYNTEIPVNEGDVFFVDAMHTYDAVIDDTLRSLKFKSSLNKKYLIYDDVGSHQEIQNAINDLIKEGYIQIVKKIGYSPDENFVVKLNDYEGVICIEL